MNSAAALNAGHVLFAITVILLVGSVLGYVARKIRVPDIVLFLIAGIILGPAVSGVLNIPATSTLSWAIIIFAASYILFDGGAELELEVLGKMWISLAIIVTIGVLITAFITGFTAQWLLGIPIMVALLLGAAMAATDPATLVPVFRQVHVRDRVAQFVVSESGFNDATGSVITLVFLAIVLGAAAGGGGDISVGHALVELVREAGIGIGIGLVIGWLASILVAHDRFALLREYMPVVTLIVVIGGYLLADTLGGSGFMAAFVAGIAMGNMHYFGLKMPASDHKRFEGFVGTSSLMSRMFIFILLGSQVNLSLIAEFWWQGLAVVAVFMFIARPVTVFLCTLPDRRAKWQFKELVFVSWTRETGVIPGAMASILVASGAPHADVLAAIVFMGILITIILQATTAKWAAGRLGLLVDDPAGEADAAK
jgi:cell volume regulation protein A